MKRTRFAVGASTLLVAGLVLAGCSADTPSGGGTASAKDPITLGAVLEVTGPFASAVEPVLNGLNLAIDQVNEEGGIDGAPLELLVEDSTSDPATGAALARTLAGKVDVVFGTVGGGGCRAIQPILDGADVLQYCQSPQPFEQTPNFFWGLAPLSDYPAATEAWLQDIGAKRLAFIGQDDASGDGYLSLFQAIVDANPGEYEIVADQRFAAGETNLETQMTVLRDADPDLIIAGTSGGNVVPVVRAVKALGVTEPVWVGTGSASVSALAPLANDLPSGGLFMNAFWVDVSGEVPDSVTYSDEVSTFAEEYQAAYGTTPGSGAGGAYDSVMQVVAALRAGATTGPEIARHLEENAFTGVLGDYATSPERHQGASLPPIMMQFGEDSQFTLAFDGS